MIGFSGEAMAKQIHFRQTLIKTVTPDLRTLGYERMDRQESVGIGVFFFRKHLFDDVHGFVSFQLKQWHPPPPHIAPTPRRFAVDLWRNRGMQPRYGHGSEEDYYGDWLYMPLGQLLWVVLDIRAYSSQYHEWEFFTSEELGTQLQDAIEKLVRYGIPWLEDPGSENPYPSWS
jgi:hypothetical protein